MKDLRNLLLISNSTNAGEEYLGWPRQIIKDYFTQNNIKTALFIPFAGVSMGYDKYKERVSGVFSPMGVEISSVLEHKDALKAVESAECIIVGGGNTFHLVAEMYNYGIMEAIREKALSGTPYIGWSAGSNVACPGLYTTNDMPIIEPKSFKTLNLVPFQINPHYLDAHPQGHGGETREDRIKEFMIVNPKTYVAGLREACLLRLKDGVLKLEGSRTMRLFLQGCETKELSSSDDLSFLLK